MPFINGRYYMNPVMGGALEAAREAEAALVALENHARQNSAGVASSDRGENGFAKETNGEPGNRSSTDAPIHRIEIDAAELVPAHSGRGARGFVARVHRQSTSGPAGMRSGNDGGKSSSANADARSETHVFADHRDLVSFLRDELANDASSNYGGRQPG